jgi:excisionase family DNA binding protein
MSQPPRSNGHLLPETPLLYSYREAAKLLRIGRTTLGDHVRAGRITPSKIGNRTLIHRDELARLIEPGGPRQDS